MQSINIKQLFSGGIIGNYHCSSRCGHCLYNSSPQRSCDYIKPENAEDYFVKIKELGCHSVHIGGGEPFLNPNGLLDLLKTAQKSGVNIDYIETNASWFNLSDSHLDFFKKLLQAGCSTLLVSISPFHNEHIPFKKTKALIKKAGECGLNIFPWISSFASDLDSFDDDFPHSLSEYADFFGQNYLKQLPVRYHLSWGGRLVSTYGPGNSIFPDLLKKGPCRKLLDTSHFHIDLYGNYLPSLCAGLSFHFADLGKPLDRNKYPLFYLLYEQGPRGLYEMVKADYAFKARDRYLNACDFCQDIRFFLFNRAREDFPELAPEGFYQEISRNNAHYEGKVL